MKRWVQWLCPAVFAAAIFAGAALLLLLPKRDLSQLEKRYLAEYPDLSWAALEEGTFQSQWEKWLSDHFPGRDAFVGINAYETLLTGRNALQEIYLAKDGYLINAPTALDLPLFTSSIQRFDNFAKNTGLPASLVLVPATGSMLEDLLPAGHGTYPDDTLFETARETASAMTVYDLRPQLAQANETGQVFYRTDHHLTAYGAYSLYAALRQAQGREARPAGDYTVTRYNGFCGTTWSGSGYFLTPPDTVELWDSGLHPTVTITDAGKDPVVSDSFFFPGHLENLDMYPVYLDGNHTLTKIENPDADGGTLLVIKDSYAHAVAPFLAEHYKTVYLLDLRYYRGNVTQLVKDYGVDELLFLYGTATLLTDSNSAWLF